MREIDDNDHIGDPRYTIVSHDKLVQQIQNEMGKKRVYKSKIIINNEKLFERDLNTFLKEAQEKYDDFKFKSIDCKDIGAYKNKENKIFGVVIFSFLVRRNK